MKKKEIAEILRDESFLNDLLDMQTVEEIQEAFFERKQIKIELKDIEVIVEIIGKIVEKNTSELSSEDLASINGGTNISKIFENKLQNFKHILNFIPHNSEAEDQS